MNPSESDQQTIMSQSSVLKKNPKDSTPSYPIDFKDISVLIPAFNEEQGVGHVVKDVKAQLPGVEIVVINDGSSDRTAECAKANGATVITHERNKGYGSSLKTGIRQTTRPYILLIDADGQHKVEDALRLIESAENTDIVIGARQRSSHVAKRRMLGKKILYWFANFLAGQKLPDFNSGLRLIRRDIIVKYLHLLPKGFSFSTTTTFTFLKGDHRITWIPIETRKRTGSSTVRQWKHGPQTILLMLRLTVLFEPLFVFLWIAAILFLLSFITAAINLVYSNGLSIGNSTVLLFVSALLIFLFGLLCDQVSAIRREIHS